MTSIFGRGPRGLPLAAVLALMALSAACGGKPEPAPVIPVAESDDADREAAERARREAEERARREAEERARREAEEAARMNAALEQMVFFDYDQARLRPDAEAALERKLELLRANPGITLRVAGHADERGSTEYNLALGNRRAMSVVEYFTGFGLDAGRFQTVSFGEERPLSNTSGEAGWARNRRAEFQITAGQIVSRQP